MKLPIGVNSKQLVQNVAKRLMEGVDSINTVNWPPRVEDLEEEAFTSIVVPDLLPSTFSLASLIILQHIAIKPTTIAINASVTLHDIRRSKELVDSFYKLGIGISYPNMLLLRDIWTMHDLEQCAICLNEIADGKTSISIIDNDDFQNDNLTGGGTAHRTNWMFLQKKTLNTHRNETPMEEENRMRIPKNESGALSKKASEMQKVQLYRAIKRGEPPLCF